MQCNKCNHKLPDDSNFCQYCGSQVLGFTVIEQTDNESIEPSQNLDPTKKDKKNSYNFTNEIKKTSESKDFATNEYFAIPNKPISIIEEYKKYVQAGKYYLKVNKWSKAKKCFSEALKIDVDSFEANLGLLFSRLKVCSFFENPRHLKIKKTKEYKHTFEVASVQEKEQLKKWVDEKEEYFGIQHEKKQKLYEKIAKVASVAIFVFIFIAFILTPTVNYVRYAYMLKNGATEKAATDFYSSKSIDFNYLTNRLFEKYGDSYFIKEDFVNAYNCYKYLDEDKHKERLYVVGCNLVKSKKYKVAEDCFLQIYDYKNSKDYYNYCKGNQLLLENNTTAYNYLNKNKKFLNTNELIKNTEWLNTLDKIQGEWYSIKKVYGYYLKEVNGGFESAKGYHDSRFYVEINENQLFDSEDKSLLIAEKVLSFKVSQGKLALFSQTKGQIQFRIENNTTLYIEDVRYKKDTE